MKRRLFRPLALAAGALATGALSFAAGSARAAAPATESPSPVAGWDDFVESLRTLPGRMLAKLPEDMRNDPQVQQEVARLALESLTSGTIDSLGGDADFPEFLPTIGYLLNVGQPNADTIYRAARIDPAGTYRLRGTRGTLNLAMIGQVVPRTAETGSGRAYLDLSTLKVDADDRFDVLISAKRPDGHAGDWWELRPAANSLMVRMVASDWDKEVAPTLSLERLDKPMGRPRRSAADLEQRLRALPQRVDMMALLFVDHVEQLRREGFVNSFKVFDITSSGGLAGQFYYEGAFDLAEDEALIVEAKAPAQCRYRSLILTNELYETIDWFNNHASLNGAQAPLDSDGVLRIVVSAKDPGVPNWLDTAGHSRGVIQGRWTDCDSQPVPSVKKVKLKNLRRNLPKDTPRISPEQRQEVIRARRAAQMQRPVW